MCIGKSWPLCTSSNPQTALRMKFVLLLFCLFTFHFSYSQKSKNKKRDTSCASFIAIIDSTLATKDGMYLNGYVVNIGWEQSRKLHGKKVKVSGKVTIERAYRKEDNLYIRQGREQDTRHIEHPKIVLLN